MNTIGHWIGGRRVDGAAARRGPVFDPARGVQTGEVAFASAAEVDGAVKVAVAAAAEWRDSPLSRRNAAMFRLRELVDARRDDLAALITAEHGKVLDDARGEVARGLDCVEFACGIPHLLKGAHSSEVSTGIDVHTVLQPVGVVVGITPFNFPVMVPLWMLANALACGNAFVHKPSEKDPSASLLLAELVREAGFPDGVHTVVQGDAEAVDALLDASRRRRRVVRRQHPDRPPRLRDRREARQAGPGARWGQEPHGRAARRRPRRRRRRRHLRRVRLGRGALHGDLRGRRGGRGRRPAGRGDRGAASPTSWSVPATTTRR